MTEEQLNRFADQLWQAIEDGDGDAARRFYHPDAVVWYNNTRKETPIDEVVANFELLKHALPDQKLTIISRKHTDDGFVQQDLLNATLPDGTAFQLATCAIVTVRDGLISRVDEYLDSAELQPLAALAG